MMNVQTPILTNATPTRYVPTQTGRMSVDALKASRGMVTTVQVIETIRLIFVSLVCLVQILFLTFLRTNEDQFLYILCSTHHASCNAVSLLLSAITELICDPSCTGNKVCQNYTVDPECVCAEGYTGEDTCTGML